MADEDQDQKTQDPTAKRLMEAHQKGNVPYSREVTSFLFMALIAAIIVWAAPGMMKDTLRMLAPFLADTENLPTDRVGMGKMLFSLTLGSLAILALPLLGAVLIALGSSILQHGVMFTTQPIAPDASRLSPLAGLKRMFSLRSVIELLKGLLKMGIVGAVGFMHVLPSLPMIRQLPGSGPEAMLLLLAKLAGDLIIGVTIAMFFIALFDLLYQRFNYYKNLRMTKQEVKDEHKQAEGDPTAKMRLRRLRMKRAQERMMSNVPKADVVITNPTHFAVALQYDAAKMKAPKLIAKGQDLIAFRIRDIARENNIPVVENPPLARALFDSTEIDEDIPIAHYEAVAKIISYVYKLKGKKLK